ncbi:hypothetical protein [Flintibacter muris]|uniref:hypothetical protein n=1 Tax=Flintibacter muris TaxID=2941327 RepID=UPI00203CE796|nr:hypothetical protein [Flintibacter muris]
MWNTLKHVKKFTTKSELDQVIGMPMFQLEDRPAYYHGKGFVVYYSPRCFRVEGIQRVEYGEPGEYAVGMYHFSNTEALKAGLGLDTFPVDDAAPLAYHTIDDVIAYGATFDEIHRWVCKNMPEYYQEGETQGLVDGKLTFLNRFIFCGPYELYFYGKSRRTKLSGFQFVFQE